MPQVNSQSDLSNINDLPTFIRFASTLLSEIVNIFNGHIEFDKNLQTQTVSVAFISANTDVAVNHNLKKTGVNYFPVSKTKACDVFTGVAAANQNTIYVQSSVANSTVTLVLF